VLGEGEPGVDGGGEGDGVVGRDELHGAEGGFGDLLVAGVSEATTARPARRKWKVFVAMVRSRAAGGAGLEGEADVVAGDAGEHLAVVDERMQMDAFAPGRGRFWSNHALLARVSSPRRWTSTGYRRCGSAPKSARRPRPGSIRLPNQWRDGVPLCRRSVTGGAGAWRSASGKTL
jgi:hypothetical protein